MHDSQPTAESGDVPVAIEAINLSKTYRLYKNINQMILDRFGLLRLLPWKAAGIRDFSALDGLNLTIRQGERVGVIGRNGAGKTTLLKLVTGNFSPSAGSLKIRGSVQALMQTGLGFHPDFSGYENIRSGLQYSGLSGKELADAIADIIDFCELKDFLYQPVSTYSLGMQTRLQFATATAIKPDILIVDEIMGAGDAYFSTKSAHRMQRLAESGCTMLVVSHSMEQIMQFCPRVIWLERGRVAAEGDALSVIKQYEEFVARLRDDSSDDEPADAPAKTSPAIPDSATPEWQKELMVGTRSSWGGVRGLKITHVWVSDESRTPVVTVRAAQPLDFNIQFVAEDDGVYTPRFVILVMSESGISLIRSLSEPMRFELRAGETATATLQYDVGPFARGMFVFSAAIYKEYDPNSPNTAVRYDLYSRSFHFNVLPKTASESGLVYVEGQWISDNEVKSC